MDFSKLFNNIGTDFTSGKLDGFSNLAATALGNALAGKNETGVGNALNTIGSLASNIPGIGGLIGAGVNLTGGLVNAAFGSHINKNFVNSENNLAAKQSGYTSNAGDNSSLLSDWDNMNILSNVTKGQVGSDGWFSHKASHKANSLNNAINDSNNRIIQSLGNTAENIDQNAALNALTDYYANGGYLNSNKYGWGGAINTARNFIKQHEGWKPTAYQRNGDVPTIGYGFTNMGFRNKYKEGIIDHYKGKITPQQANQELNWYLTNAAKNLSEIYGNKLNDSQKAAVLDSYYQRPASVRKGSAFYNAVMKGSPNAINYLGVSGFNSRNADRRALFSTGSYSPSQSIEQQDNTFIKKPDIDFNIPNQNIQPITNNLPSTPGIEDILHEIVPDQTAQNALPTVEGIMDNYNNFFNEGILAYGGNMNNKIHINPKNKGKLTATAKRTGKSFSELAHSSNPITRKRAIFALNAAKWKHAFGGTLNNMDPLFSNMIFPYPSSYFNAFKEGGSMMTKNGNYSPKMKKKADFAENFIHADGGYLNSNIDKISTHGTSFSNGLDYIDEGGSHEQNPNGGVPVGVDNNGIPNLVEQGEVIWNGNYVFSRRIMIPKEVSKTFNLPDNISFAQAANKLSEYSKERGNDPIAMKTLKVNMSRLMDAQEMIRQQKKEDQKVQQVNKHAPGGPLDNDLPEITATAQYPWLKGNLINDELPVPSSISNAPGKYESIPQNNPKQISSPSYLRYAPIFGSALSALQNIMSNPDYGNADAIINASEQTEKPVSIPVNTVNDYVHLSPFDPYYNINTINQNAASMNRSIQNQSGGNRAQAIAGILAGNAGTQNSLAAASRQAYLENQQRALQQATFNRGTNQFNSQEINQRNMEQAQLNASRASQMLNGLARGYSMKQAMDDIRNNALSRNMSSLYNDLGNMGTENEQRNWLNSLAKSGVLKAMFSGNNGDITYSGNKKAMGGRLKKRRF